MTRPWKRKTILKDGQVVTMKQLIKVGDSLALVIPKDWIRHFAVVDDRGKYWVRVHYRGTNRIIVGGNR
jgi:hypothetical protein